MRRAAHALPSGRCLMGPSRVAPRRSSRCTVSCSSPTVKARKGEYPVHA